MSEDNNENNNTPENNEPNNKNPLDQAPIESTGDIFTNNTNSTEKEEKEIKEEKDQKEIKEENQKEKKDDINININEDNNNNLPSYQNFQENNINNNIYKNIPKENNIPPKNNENNKRYDHDNKKISQIIDRCESLYNQSRILYENYDIQKAITNLSNAIKGLDGLKQSILNNKTEFNNFLPQVTSMRTKYFNLLHKYHLTIYQLIPKKFAPVRFNQGESLQEFAKKYILTEPFVTFDDIYEQNLDQNKTLKYMIYDNYQKSLRLKYKNLLLFGPKGSGKTLAVHALANQLKAKVAQLEGIELFKVPNFSLEFVKAAFNHMSNKPLIIYIRNIEKMFTNMNNFNFIYDKVSSSKLNIILIVSTSILQNQLPKELLSKFHYTYCIRPCEKSQKINLIKFICNKIGININVSDKDLNEFAYQNLRNYSNEDIFNLIMTAIDLKKNNYGNSYENLEILYKEGINGEELKNASKIVQGSLNPEVMKNYYL